MRVEQATETIAKFFNDLIGAWVPGAVLTVGLALMHLGPVQLQSLFKLGETALASLTFAGVLFATGHTLLALHEQFLQKWLSKGLLVTRFNETSAKTRKSYLWFERLVEDQQGAKGGWDYKDLRSVALSISTEAASLGRRFMFISLLCKGVGTALAILAVDFAICSMFFPHLLFAYGHAAPWLIQVTLLLGIAFVLFRHGEVFFCRAMSTPFSVATAELKFNRQTNAPPG